MIGRLRWPLLVIVPAFLVIAFVAGGGIYRIANAGAGQVYVINRFTGSSRLLQPDTDKVVPPEVLARLKARAELTEHGSDEPYVTSTAYFNLYNGSAWTLTDITVSITVSARDGTEIRNREYSLSPTTGSDSCLISHRTGEWAAELGFRAAPAAALDWHVVSGRGYRE